MSVGHLSRAQAKPRQPSSLEFPLSPPGDAADILDVGEAIDNSPVQLLHYGIFTLCALGMIMDGFDVQALGYVAQSIIQE